MGYRTSRVRTEGLVVLTATLSLEPGSEEDIRARMDDLTARREAKQPLEYPSAGSTFKRPEGHFAGKLVTDAGLKGFSVGGAMVSEKHAGFVINAGGASAADVLAVIRHVQDEVRRQFGVSLEPEVRMLGDMGPDASTPSA
jgi:UDP-N-acetylmuramate dehydrogenase